MYYLLSVLCGIVIAAMIAINGKLSGYYGIYTATALIHFIGLILVGCILLWKKESPFSQKRISLLLYLGGAVGVATTVFNNIAFGKIGVSAILALGLMGQSVTSILIDEFGLFQMPKQKFNKKKILGLLFVLVGIFFLLK